MRRLWVLIKSHVDCGWAIEPVLFGPRVMTASEGGRSTPGSSSKSSHGCLGLSCVSAAPWPAWGPGEDGSLSSVLKAFPSCCLGSGPHVWRMSPEIPHAPPSPQTPSPSGSLTPPFTVPWSESSGFVDPAVPHASANESCRGPSVGGQRGDGSRGGLPQALGTTASAFREKALRPPGLRCQPAPADVAAKWGCLGFGACGCREEQTGDPPIPSEWDTPCSVQSKGASPGALWVPSESASGFLGRVESRRGETAGTDGGSVVP